MGIKTFFPSKKFIGISANNNVAFFQKHAVIYLYFVRCKNTKYAIINYTLSRLAVTVRKSATDTAFWFS